MSQRSPYAILQVIRDKQSLVTCPGPFRTGRDEAQTQYLVITRRTTQPLSHSGFP
jgi:hypothetical protein